jgi:hypothetical protein
MRPNRRLELDFSEFVAKEPQSLRRRNMNGLRALSYMLFIFSFFVANPILPAQTIEKFPEALGTYLSADEGWLSLKEEGGFKAYEGQIPPELRDWTNLNNTNRQDAPIISYSAFGAMRDPEKLRLYRLATKTETKPYIQPPAEIELSIVPVLGVTGLLGNMVKLIPKGSLVKGNYVLTYPGIEKNVELSWRFTVNGGYQSLLPFGVYLVKSTELIECQAMSLEHPVKGKSSSLELKRWATPPVQDINTQDSIYTYSKSRAFMFNQLVPKKHLKPEISPLRKIELSAEYIGGSMVLGNVVRLTPINTTKEPLVKGNYLLTDAPIDTASNCWGFTIDGGEPLWNEMPKGCLGCLYVTGAVVALVLALFLLDYLHPWP